MATTKKNSSKIDEAEARTNFMYGLGVMKQNGDKEGLARAKKANPALYADWEKRQVGMKKNGKK